MREEGLMLDFVNLFCYNMDYAINKMSATQKNVILFMLLM